MQENLYKYFSTERNFISLANKKNDNNVFVEKSCNQADQVRNVQRGSGMNVLSVITKSN